ncbi:peptide-methionine (R)-S-oxide reductase [Candidatus Roizmanbacteria bacterium RIFCSPHIGHO2_01_FULL_39_12c]|uniref:peptide-methionine (R)-S-oxide reductase n=1 Tax=Candidatus Roizmanbacteria bacterium RIFCSPHIGHO2_01_FULL_39_12c TaxID=1802031 RepID=A0A1F7GCP3_9BACT|nr:MAG: peptide-methionine (R)-S-oxide reductase [Candidatus Roizmanbacteria bacterium RIFCSPHIGHO2_01_FULL_39_12c]OGK46487.1 MAG: peptide-methionine (R)-S-oxide reductase [Candidatus Roizmanbacteria bacterium RIFCSPLOWO2_01_FULL_40_13]
MWRNNKMKKIGKKLLEKLSKEQIDICFYKGTEAPFSGKYLHNKEKGMYHCTVCSNALFSSDTKFESGTGWPSFYDVVKKGNIKLLKDETYGMHRTEVLCANCETHLGHVFDDGPQDKTGLRYCINSLALDFKKSSA